jgi:DNA-binding NarL/FixJ family response regulator
MSTVRILIADDHEVVRCGVKALLGSRPGWEVVGEAANGREALEKAKELKPDVIILDITMPELNGVEATRKIVNAVPGTEVLILTMHESEKLIRRLLEAGARGYVSKSDIARSLVDAVEARFFHITGRHNVT